jgi:prephenate dehydrogenase
MEDDIIVTLKRSNDHLMTFGNDYSDVFLPAIDEIKLLRLANSDLQMWYDYAKTECDKLQAEVLRLREALQHMLRWHDQLSLADIAKAKAALKEKE